MVDSVLIDTPIVCPCIVNGFARAHFKKRQVYSCCSGKEHCVGDPKKIKGDMSSLYKDDQKANSEAVVMDVLWG
jgi:hypothetical protein